MWQGDLCCSPQPVAVMETLFSSRTTSSYKAVAVSGMPPVSFVRIPPVYFMVLQVPEISLSWLMAS